MKKQTILSLLAIGFLSTVSAQPNPPVSTPESTPRPFPKQEETKNPSEPTGPKSPNASGYPHANQTTAPVPTKVLQEEKIVEAAPPAPITVAPQTEETPTPQAPSNNTSSPEPKEPETSTTIKADSDGNASVSAGGATASKSGINAGSMSLSNYDIGDVNYQRISWRPEFALGKFGIALDLELILADGQLSDQGWNFDSREETLNTLYRKIYYVRWDQPGAPFYAKLGALDGITLDAGGLISNNWGNTSLYPKRKDLGVHLQINETLSPFNMSFEVLNNALQDWNNDGGIIGGKFSFTPIASLGLPVLSDLRLGVAAMGDLNQYAALEDSDGDLCPDQLEDIADDFDFSSNPDFCKDYRQQLPNPIEDAKSNTSGDAALEKARSDADQDAKAIKENFGKGNDFYLAAVDAYLPILNSSLLTLSLHAEYARPIGDQGELIEESWAAIPLGFNAKAFIFRFGADYLQMDKAFQLGHFDANYDKYRAQITNKKIMTKEDLYWNKDLGFRHGVFGRLGADLYAIDISGQYVHLITDEDNIPDDRSFKSKVALAPSLLEMIPKITRVEAFYNKDRIGQDTYPVTQTDGTIVTEHDSFWEPSFYTMFGTSVGIEMAPGMEIIWTTFYRWNERDKTTGKLGDYKSEMLMETVFTF